ncbi:MAG: aldo/keto reductase [Cyclobacteriaceae bacterium]
MNEYRKMGLGTAAIGRPHYINIKQEKAEEFNLEKFKESGMKLLESTYQQGIRYFDTAPGYGIAEQLLIEWLKGKNDSSIEVATKWGYTYRANFDPNAKVHEVKDHGIDQLDRQWKNSRALLPFLSTLQIHSATLDSGVLKNQEVLDRLAELKEEFGIKIGITTTGDNQVEVIKQAMNVTANGSPLFEVYQVTYNILDQSLATISQELNSMGRRIVIKEAMANGRLFQNLQYPHYADLYNTLSHLATKYGFGIDALALRFCIDTLNPFKVLSGGAKDSHVQQNLKANDFSLEKADLELLKSFEVNTKDYWAERKQLQWN